MLNTPGSAPNAATAIDGYPLAQQGKAGMAIGAAASANAIGGIIGTVSVLAILPIAKDIVLPINYITQMKANTDLNFDALAR